MQKMPIEEIYTVNGPFKKFIKLSLASNDISLIQPGQSLGTSLLCLLD